MDQFSNASQDRQQRPPATVQYSSQPPKLTQSQTIYNEQDVVRQLTGKSVQSSHYINDRQKSNYQPTPTQSVNRSFNFENRQTYNNNSKYSPANNSYKNINRDSPVTKQSRLSGLRESELRLYNNNNVPTQPTPRSQSVQGSRRNFYNQDNNIFQEKYTPNPDDISKKSNNNKNIKNSRLTRSVDEKLIQERIKNQQNSKKMKKIQRDLQQEIQGLQQYYDRELQRVQSERYRSDILRPHDIKVKCTYCQTTKIYLPRQCLDCGNWYCFTCALEIVKKIKNCYYRCNPYKFNIDLRETQQQRLQREQLIQEQNETDSEYYVNQSDSLELPSYSPERMSRGMSRGRSQKSSRGPSKKTDRHMYYYNNDDFQLDSVSPPRHPAFSEYRNNTYGSPYESASRSRYRNALNRSRMAEKDPYLTYGPTNYTYQPQTYLYERTSPKSKNNDRYHFSSTYQRPYSTSTYQNSSVNNNNSYYHPYQNSYYGNNGYSQQQQQQQPQHQNYLQNSARTNQSYQNNPYYNYEPNQYQTPVQKGYYSPQKNAYSSPIAQIVQSPAAQQQSPRQQYYYPQSNQSVNTTSYRDQNKFLNSYNSYQTSTQNNNNNSQSQYY